MDMEKDNNTQQQEQQQEDTQTTGNTLEEKIRKTFYKARLQFAAMCNQEDSCIYELGYN